MNYRQAFAEMVTYRYCNISLHIVSLINKISCHIQLRLIIYSFQISIDVSDLTSSSCNDKQKVSDLLTSYLIATPCDLVEGMCCWVQFTQKLYFSE